MGFSKMKQLCNWAILVEFALAKQKSQVLVRKKKGELTHSKIFWP
jgi:hypothetical protein